MVGGGGILINPEGKIEVRYVWGMGTKINNQAEALGLMLGLSLVWEKGIREVVILGDSLSIIKHLVKGTLAQN